MARKPSRPAPRVGPTAKAAAPRESNSPATEREKIIAAFLTLLAENTD